MIKTALALLVATTALAIGVPAIRALADADERPFRAFLADGREALSLVFVGDDDEDHRKYRRSSRHDLDRDDDDDDHDDDDDDHDDDLRGERNPAMRDPVAPPQNGLFGNGALPRAQVN